MLQNLFTKAPLIAVLGALLVFVIVAGAGMGLEWPLLLAVAAIVFAVAEGWGLWLLWHQKQHTERHLRHIRFIADRFQAMIRSMPGGYCLFTPQGLLREEHGVAERLGAEKITHMDELIAAVKEGPELLEAFRKLQLSGTDFMLSIHAMNGDKPLHVAGRRFRIGVEGPHVDVLWFCDHLAEIVQVMAKASPLVAAKEAAAAAVVTQPAVPAARPQVIEVPIVNPTGACFDALPIPVWGRDKDGALVLCNGSYAKAVDAAASDVVSAQMELMSSAPKSIGPRDLAAKAAATGETQRERRHAVINGQRRFLEFVEFPFTLQQAEGKGPALATLGYAIDVTAEEDKDTELRRHLVSQHEVLEHLGAAISVFGPDHRLEFYNRAYQRLWDIPESTLDAKPTFSEILEDLRSRRRLPEQVDFQKYKKERLALFTSLLEPREDVMYLPDGTSLRILAAPHPLGGLMFVHENVTHQLALETSYNTLMAVQRETIDNLAEGIAVFGPDGKLRLSNPALAKLWGLPVDYLAQEPHVGDIIEHARVLLDRAEDWDAYKAEMISYALDRNPHAGRIERTDQKIIEFLTVPLPDGSVLNSFLDVTDSVRVEQALRASNAALAAADRLKSDFVANVSYQLRTPLNTITGFAEILAEQYFGTLNERQLEYTTTIKSESEKLSRLINDVLDLATIEAGRMTIDRHQVGVANLLNAAKQMTAEWARQQSLDIIIDCPSDLGTFEVDEHRMKQVLFNLISNAIKYTPPGGQIALAAWKQDPWIVISVLDTGVGIPKADQDRVFGKFEKAHAHLRQGGAGLGLSLVKSFVELHGGRVEIFSDEKDGTRVSCFLPQKPPEKPQITAEA